MKIKVVFLTEIISPYRIPVFNEIAKSIGDEFAVLFFGETEKRRKWKIYKEKIKFRYEILPAILFQKEGSSPCFFNPTIFLRLIKYSPDVLIIGGYYHPSCLLAMLYAKIFKRQAILWCESTKNEQRFNQVFKRAYKRWFLANCDWFVAAGKASFEYLISLGVKQEKISVAPNAIDNDCFAMVCEEYKAGKQAFKKIKGYPEKIILYVGRLIEQKGVLDLLKSFQMLAREQSNLGLLLVGSGEAEKKYKDFCQENILKNVFFAGFVHQEELPLYYAIADIFVLPTHSDPWGLVLNEAMACKLPVISSDVAGAACNLIQHGENGYIFKKGDIRQLAVYLKDLLSDERKSFSMGLKSSEIIKSYSPSKCAQGFIRAIEQI